MACAKLVVNVRWAKAVKEGSVACEGAEEEGDEKPPLAPPKEGNMDEGDETSPGPSEGGEYG